MTRRRRRASAGVRSNDGPTSNAAVLGRLQEPTSGCGFFVGRSTRTGAATDSNQRGRPDTMTTKSRNRNISRRTFLKASAGTAALLGAAQAQFPGGAFAQAAGPEVKGAKLGFIALTDAAPLFVAKEKGIFAKYGVPDTEVLKQASWGATRDNLVLGGEGNGIDGAHILTPMPYLISAGKVTQNNVPTPMYILARLNLNGQCISVAKEYDDLKVGVDTTPFKAALEKKKASGKAVKAANDLPGRHARPLDPLLARRRRHRSRQGHRDHHGAAAADGGEHEGRHHGLLLRLRAVEPAAHPPEHRLHRDHHRRTLEQASGEVARHARRLRRQESEGRQGHPDGGDGSAAVVREAGEPRRGRRDLRQAAMDQLPGRGHHRPRQGQVRLRHSRQGGREAPADHAVLERLRLVSVPEPRPLVHHRGHPLGQVRGEHRRQGADQQGQPRGHVARGRQGRCRSPAAQIPDVDVARQGDLLRRQGVRSGKSGRLPQEPCRSSAPRSAEREPPGRFAPAARHLRNGARPQ